jgi:hypothetical protein
MNHGFGFPRPDWLQTGDSQRKQFDITEKVLRDLFKNGYKPVRALADRIGVFAHVMKTNSGDRIFVVTKGSAIWKDTVSCQAYLPSHAAQERAALVIALLQDSAEDPRYFIFNPKEIDRKSIGYNVRQGVQFVNFSILLGIETTPAHFTEEFEKLKQRGYQAKLG